MPLDNPNSLCIYNKEGERLISINHNIHWLLLFSDSLGTSYEKYSNFLITHYKHDVVRITSAVLLSPVIGTNCPNKQSMIKNHQALMIWHKYYTNDWYRYLDMIFKIGWLSAIKLVSSLSNHIDRLSL